MKWLLIILALLGLRYVFPHLKVIGDSMHPTYKNGEHLIGFRFYPARFLKPGDVIVFLQDLYEGEEKAVIKRIERVKTVGHNIYFYVLGDNPPESLDSREYGFVHHSKFICRPFNQRTKK